MSRRDRRRYVHRVSQHGPTDGGRRENDEPPSRPVCAHCADIIGVYERVWVKLTDGSLRESSLLNLAKDTPPGQSITGIWHADCIAADAVARCHET